MNEYTGTVLPLDQEPSVGLKPYDGEVFPMEEKTNDIVPEPSDSFNNLMQSINTDEADRVKKSIFLSDMLNTSATRNDSDIKIDADHVYSNLDSYDAKLKENGIDVNKPSSMLGNSWDLFKKALSEPSPNVVISEEKKKAANIGAVEAVGSLATMIPGVLGGISAVVGRIEGAAVHGEPLSWTIVEEAFNKGMGATSYQPKTEVGQRDLAFFMTPFTKANEIVSEWGDTEEEKARNRVILNAVFMGLPLIKKGGKAYIGYLKKGEEGGLLKLSPEDVEIYQKSTKFKEEMATQVEAQSKGMESVINTIKNDSMITNEHPAIDTAMDYLAETTPAVGSVAAVEHLKETHIWNALDDTGKKIVEDAVDKVLNPEPIKSSAELTIEAEQTKMREAQAQGLTREQQLEKTMINAIDVDTAKRLLEKDKPIDEHLAEGIEDINDLKVKENNIRESLTIEAAKTKDPIEKARIIRQLSNLKEDVSKAAETLWEKKEGIEEPAPLPEGKAGEVKEQYKTLYHGTGEDFEHFNSDIVFATSDKKYAEAYTFKGNKPNIKEINVQLKNPVKLDEYADFKLTTTLQELTDVLESNGYKNIAKDLSSSEYKDIYPEGYEFEAWEVLSSNTFKDIAVKYGHDGVIGTEGGHEIYGIYDKVSIKSPKVLKDYPDLQKQAEVKTEVKGKAQLPIEKKTIEGEGKPTSAQNAVTDAEREAAGLPPIEKAETKPVKQSFKEGGETVISGEFSIREAEKIVEKPRPISDVETVALEGLRVKNNKEYDMVNDKISEAKRKGNTEEVESLTKDRERLEADRDTIDNALKSGGTESGRAQRIRQEFMAQDYSLATMIRRAKADSPTGEITEIQRAEYTELAKKIADAKAELEKFNEAKSQREAQLAVDKIKEHTERKQRSEKRTYAKAELDLEFNDLSKELDKLLSTTQLNVGFDPTALKVLGKMARNRVMKGVLTIEEIVADIHNSIKDKYSNVTERDIRDAISGYGKTIQLSKEEIEVQYREVKRQGRLISALEDAQAGLRPLKSGLQRDKQTDRVREIQRQVHEEMKKAGLDKEGGKTPEEQWKTSLGAIKTRLEHAISDNARQILERKKNPPKEGVRYDAEATALQDFNKLLKDALENIVGKPEKSSERKTMEVESRLEKSIAEYDRKINAGEVPSQKQATEITSPKIKELQAVRDDLKKQYEGIKEDLKKQKAKSPEEIALKKKMSAVEKSIADYEGRIINDTKKVKAEQTEIVNSELKELTDYRDTLKKTYKEMQDALEPKLTPDEAANKRFKAYAENRIKKLEDMIASGDFAKKGKREITYDKESLDIRFKLDEAIKEYQQKQFDWQLENRTTLQKAGSKIMEVVNLSRAIKTSFDLSAVLRQGAFIVLGHPIRGIKAIPDMFKALKSRKGQFEVEQGILNHPNYKLSVKSGLYLAEHGHKLTSMEEVYMSMLAEKIPGVAASQRAYTTFLNKLRFDSFNSMVENLAGSKNAVETKAIANFINIATGRGNFGMKQNALVGLNTVFFAPRYVASRFQLLVGQPLFKGTANTRVMIAKEYARFLIGVGTIYTLSKAMGADIETDPRSSDFGKIRLGNTRVDPLAGLSQTSVLTGRLLTGETKSLTGKVTPIRGENVPFGKGNSADVIARFLRSKLSPVVGTGVDILAGKDVVGQPVTAGSLPDKLLTPLAFNDIYSAMQEQGVPAGAALGLLSIFGMGLQTYSPYDAREEKRKKIERMYNSSNRNWASEVGGSMVKKRKAVNE